MTKKKYQFVNWFPEWIGFEIRKPKFGMSIIYDWYFLLGFWEIRRWCKNPKEALRRYKGG